MYTGVDIQICGRLSGFDCYAFVHFRSFPLDFLVYYKLEHRFIQSYAAGSARNCRGFMFRRSF